VSTYFRTGHSHEKSRKRPYYLAFCVLPVFRRTFSLEILKHDISRLLLVTLLTLNLIRKMRLSYSSGQAVEKLFLKCHF
jgi:hypothetical protein